MTIRKTVLTVFAILLCGLLSFRILQINSNVQTIQQEEYAMNDWVSLDGAFQDTAKEHTQGYSVRVSSVQIKTITEFLNEYECDISLLEHENPPDHVLDIGLEFMNKGNTDGYIQIGQYYIEGSHYFVSMNSKLWGLIQPSSEGEMGFRLRENSSYNIHVPYSSDEVDLATVSKDDVHVIVSKAPIKKVVRLTFQEMDGSD